MFTFSSRVKNKLIPNIQTYTGKEIDEWKNILKKYKTKSKNKRITYLINNYGLKPYFSKLIVEHIYSDIEIFNLYSKLQNVFYNNIKSNENFKLFCDIFISSFSYISTLSTIQLTSKVKNKKYFAFEKNGVRSRAINEELFIFDYKSVLNFLWKAVKSNDFKNYSPEEINKYCYTIVISFFSVVDLEKKGDQKTPGTFFEYFIGFLIGRFLNRNPKKDIEVLNLDDRSELTIDFYIDLGNRMPKFHIPIKTSTRERVIQVWAHQRVLDGIYGTGRFFGIPVILSENKTDSKKLEVIEICMPEQWRIYQMFIAQLKRVYYLDIPEIYLNLNKNYPKIQVKIFGHFFHELEDLID